MRDAVSGFHLGGGDVLGARAMAPKAAHVPPLPLDSHVVWVREDPCHSVSWLLLGFCWQCCTCKCFLFLPEPLKGCQPMPWLNVWVEADTWDVVTGSRRDSNCLSPLKPEQKGASLAFLWNLGIWLLHCKDRNSYFWKAGLMRFLVDMNCHTISFQKCWGCFPQKATARERVILAISSMINSSSKGKTNGGCN